MIEVEIRAKIQDPEKVKQRLKDLRVELFKTEKQIDHIFGRDKDLDENHKMIEGRFVARLRERNNQVSLEFKEIKRSGAGLEISSPLSKLEDGQSFLASLDFKKAFAIVKQREIYRYQDCEICLDSVDSLGQFVEIEYIGQADGEKTALEKCRDLLRALDPTAISEPKKYGDLMQEMINKRKTA